MDIYSLLAILIIIMAVKYLYIDNIHTPKGIDLSELIRLEIVDIMNKQELTNNNSTNNNSTNNNSTNNNSTNSTNNNSTNNNSTNNNSTNSTNNNSTNNNSTNNNSIRLIDDREIINKRDEDVLYNELYPPLNRSSNSTTMQLFNNIKDRYINNKSRGVPNDSPHLLGYFHKKDDNDKIYKLFGWAKYQGSTSGYFYYTNVNNNKPIKYPLDNLNSNLKHIDIIPNIINIKKGPIIGEFEFNELSKSDLEMIYI